MTSQRHSIEVDEFVPYPASRVWRALVDPQELAQWSMASDFRPEVGHRFTLDTGRWGLTHCVVIAVVALPVIWAIVVGTAIRYDIAPWRAHVLGALMFAFFVATASAVDVLYLDLRGRTETAVVSRAWTDEPTGQPACSFVAAADGRSRSPRSSVARART